MKTETADQTNELSDALVALHDGEGVAVQGDNFYEMRVQARGQKAAPSDDLQKP